MTIGTFIGLFIQNDVCCQKVSLFILFLILTLPLIHSKSRVSVSPYLSLFRPLSLSGSRSCSRSFFLNVLLIDRMFHALFCPKCRLSLKRMHLSVYLQIPFPKDYKPNNVLICMTQNISSIHGANTQMYNTFLNAAGERLSCRRFFVLCNWRSWICLPYLAR